MGLRAQNFSYGSRMGFGAVKVFVVGNIAVDQTLAVDRMPVEGESILGVRISTDLGGKGTNQAIVLARSGIQTVLIAGLGADLQASQMRDMLVQEPLTTRLITMNDCASDTSIVLKDAAGGNVIVTTVDCARAMTIEDVIPHLTDANAGDMVVLQGNLTLPTTAAIIAVARERELKVALNPSPLDPDIAALLPDLDLVFLNEHEAHQITGQTGADAVTSLLAMGIVRVVVTLGDRGSLLGADGSVSAVPAQRCNVVDSTGAGDTLQSVAIASALTAHRAITTEDLTKAAAAAALTVSRPGTVAAFPTQTELHKLLGS